MSKNKPMSRIDLDYNKNLKYPDINDYLNDTVYASNLTEFPDNQASAITAFKLVPNTTKYNYKILIAGHEWKVFLGTFKMYGYNPDLEAVEKMRLTIDFLNDGDESKNYTMEIRKRSTKVFFNVIGQSDPRSLPLVGAVNYFIDFDPEVMNSIYNYVFDTRWEQASEYYRNKVYTDTPSEGEKQAYINYVKYRIYRLRIPVRIEYFYVKQTQTPVADEEPGGVLQFNMTLQELIPTYQSYIDFSSKEVQVNNEGKADLLDYLKVSYTSSTVGKMLLKAAFQENPDSQEIEPDARTVGTVEEKINVSLMVQKYMVAQHSGFDLSYPSLVFTYDFTQGEGAPSLVDKEFDVFTASPRLGKVNELVINSYRYGHKVKKTNVLKDNPFQVSINFSTNTAKLTENIHLRKFQLQFKQAKGLVIDPDPVLSPSSVESLLIAGDFFQGTSTRLVQNASKTMRTTNNIYRSYSVGTNKLHIRMFAQRTEEKDDVEFEQKDLSNFKAELTAAGSTGSTYNYNLTITWPASVNIKGLYNILKARWIVLSISDMFQQIFLQSKPFEKNPWDRNINDLTNPAYTLTYNDLPVFIIRGLSGDATSFLNIDPVKEPFFSAINDQWLGQYVKIKNNAKVFKFAPVSKNTHPAKYVSFDVQNFVYNGRSTYASHSNAFVMLNAIVVLAHKIGLAKNFTYLVFKSNGVFRFSQLIQESSAVQSPYYYEDPVIPEKVNWRVDYDSFRLAMQKSTAKNPLQGGSYKVYIIPNLISVSNTQGLNLYTSQLGYAIAGKDSSYYESELVFEYSWSA